MRLNASRSVWSSVLLAPRRHCSALLRYCSAVGMGDSFQGRKKQNPQPETDPRGSRTKTPGQYIRGQCSSISPKSISAKVSSRRLAALAIRDVIKRDLLSFIKATHPRAFDGADVHEHIFAAVTRLDEAKPFLAVEPLYSSLRHNSVLRFSAHPRIYTTALSRGLFKSSLGKSSVRR